MAEYVVNDCRMHVQRLGSGSTTTVFIHGLVMDNLSSWYFTVANRIAQTGSVFLYDLRGHGRSERTPTGYSVSALVHDLHRLLKAADVEGPVRIVGNSFGGLLAIAYAHTYPESTAALVLVDAHWSDTGWSDTMIETLSLQGDARNAKIADSFKHWLGRHSQRKRNRLATSAQALVEETTMLSDLRDSEAISVDALANLRMPVLAMYGSHSDILHRGKRLAHCLPHCDLRIFEGCSHSILWEATDKITHEIESWLTGIDRVRP
jgi:pimeloyl-ACP methyl ester carboxylesterase